MRSLQALVLALGLLPSVAAAQTSQDERRNAARDLGQKGNLAFERGDYSTALDLYRRASTLYPVPTLSVRLGRSLVKLGRLVEAEEAYIQTLRYQLTDDAPDAFKQAVVVAKSDLAELAPRVPRLKVEVVGGGQPSVMVDGKLLEPALVGVSRKVDPGTYMIRAEAPGSIPTEARVHIRERAREQLRLVLKADPNAKPAPTTPEPGAPSEPQDTKQAATGSMLPYVAMGIGGLGLGLGVVTGLMASGRRSDAEGGCPDSRCARGSDAEADMNAFRDLRTLSSIGYVVGAVGVAAGGVLWLTLADSGDGQPQGARRTPRLGAYFTAASAGLRGDF